MLAQFYTKRNLFSFRLDWHLCKDDLALIELAEPFPLSATVSPVCLSATEVQAGMPLGNGVVIAGWGQLNLTTDMDSLHMARLDVAPADQCSE